MRSHQKINVKQCDTAYHIFTYVTLCGTICTNTYSMTNFNFNFTRLAELAFIEPEELRNYHANDPEF